MSAPASTVSATSETHSLDGWERALLDRQLEALGRLADMGMAIAAAIERRATAEGPEADGALRHAPMDFARVSRAVRMTFALQSRLIAEFKSGVCRAAMGEPDADGPIEVMWAGDLEDQDEAEQKDQVRAVVQRLGEAASLDQEAVERLVSEAGERLDDDDIYRDLSRRPLGEVVALICKDLGIEPDWELLSGIYWAKEEIARPPPGSPYAGWKERQAQAERPLHPSGPPPPRAGEDVFGV
jgi:hypothetical protein